jgi:hypothetical protein
MTNRPQAAGLVAEFLRDALAGGALAVPNLEVMARAAGLLGEGQCITHSKVFKGAKKSLGIRSVRNGFGDGGEWLWLLEKQPDPPAREPPVSIEDTYAEAHDPKEIPADVRRIPSSWIDGVAGLDYLRPFTDIPLHRWRQFSNDCNNFLNSNENWAERAAQLGWDAVALFGCHRDRPPRRPRSSLRFSCLRAASVTRLGARESRHHGKAGARQAGRQWQNPATGCRPGLAPDLQHTGWCTGLNRKVIRVHRLSQCPRQP